jgi:hypothetical protein
MAQFIDDEAATVPDADGASPISDEAGPVRSNTKTDRWIFTCNTPPAEWDPRNLWDPASMLYMTGQKEAGEENEREHVHLYIVWRTRKLFSQVRRWAGRVFPTGHTPHIDPVRGTETEARDYVTKTQGRIDGPWEFGACDEGRVCRSDSVNLSELVDQVSQWDPELDDGYRSPSAAYQECARGDSLGPYGYGQDPSCAYEVAGHLPSQARTGPVGEVQVGAEDCLRRVRLQQVDDPGNEFLPGQVALPTPCKVFRQDGVLVFGRLDQQPGPEYVVASRGESGAPDVLLQTDRPAGGRKCSDCGDPLPDTGRESRHPRTLAIGGPCPFCGCTSYFRCCNAYQCDFVCSRCLTARL